MSPAAVSHAAAGLQHVCRATPHLQPGEPPAAELVCESPPTILHQLPQLGMRCGNLSRASGRARCSIAHWPARASTTTSTAGDWDAAGAITHHPGDDGDDAVVDDRFCQRIRPRTITPSRCATAQRSQPQPPIHVLAPYFAPIVISPVPGCILACLMTLRPSVSQVRHCPVSRNQVPGGAHVMAACPRCHRVLSRQNE